MIEDIINKFQDVKSIPSREEIEAVASCVCDERILTEVEFSIAKMLDDEEQCKELKIRWRHRWC